MNRHFPFHRLVARPPRAGGFTLVETLVTLAIAALLITLGAPSMRHLLARHAMATDASGLLDALQLARSEAMKRGGPVILCKTDPLAVGACAAGANVGWQTWMMFADIDRSGRYDAGEPVIRAQTATSSLVGVTSDPELASVRFQPTGIVLTNGAASGAVFVFALRAGGSAADSAAGSEARDRLQVCLNSRGSAMLLDARGVCQ